MSLSSQSSEQPSSISGPVIMRSIIERWITRSHVPLEYSAFAGPSATTLSSSETFDVVSRSIGPRPVWPTPVVWPAWLSSV